MPRDFRINGPTLVLVKGSSSDQILGDIKELGLSDQSIRVQLDIRHRDINVDAWGGEIPADVQCMLAGCNVIMSLIHLDLDVLDACIRASMGGTNAIGFLPRTGARLGNDAARFAGGGLNARNHYIGLNLTSPVLSKPWRFYTTYLQGIQEIPLGAEKSIYQLNWRVIPYTQDPYSMLVANYGQGGLDHPLWDHTLDT